VSGAVIVTTPQDVSILDARKTVMFARQLNIPVIGIIENMSGFVCPHCGQETAIFKKGGGGKAAGDLGVPFLGSIPFEPELVELADRGVPFISSGKIRPPPRPSCKSRKQSKIFWQSVNEEEFQLYLWSRGFLAPGRFSWN